MMKVIGAGFGRTGTASLKAALDHLGFGPCYHMYELLAEPERVHDWRRALSGENVAWDEIFAGYQSTVDWPGCAFWRELVSRYPEAKGILTERDPDRWYESTYNTIYQIGTNDTPGSGSGSEPGSDEDVVIDQLRPTIRKMIWDGTFSGRFADRSHAIEVFTKHNAEVRATVPPERLLVFHVSEGWRPLCEFLRVDVPAEDFPHINDTGSMPELIARIRQERRFPSPFDHPDIAASSDHLKGGPRSPERGSAR